MSLLAVEKTLKEALAVLDEYGLSMAGIHVANALQFLEEAIAQEERASLGTAAGGITHNR